METERTGKCCENFAVPVSPEELEASYLSWLAQDRDLKMMKMDTKNRLNDRQTIWQEIYLLYPMMEYLYSDNTHPNGNITTEHKIWHHYRCRFHNNISGLCKIYDIRPRMCRTFPECEPCKYEGCSCAGDCRFRPQEKETVFKEDKIVSGVKITDFYE